MRVLVTGGTGFIGVALSRHWIERGESVTVLTRNAASARAKLGSSVWPVERLDDVGDVDVVVSLAGEPLFGKRWNEELKRRCVASRVEGTRDLVAFMAKAANKPKLFLSASAIGYYGDTGDRTIDEHQGPGDDFAAKLCAEWEKAALEAKRIGVRTCLLRIGLVLGRGGGVLSELGPQFKKGFGGPVGSGKQWMSWIHMDDMVGLVDHLEEHEELEGAINFTAPEPVTNRDFANEMAQAVGKRAFLRTPGIVLRLALGEGASMILTGQRVLPVRATQSGYAFRHETLGPSLRSLMS